MPSHLTLLKKFKKTVQPHSAYVVGGAVRDRLLGRPIVDIDVAVPGDSSVLAAQAAYALNGRTFVLDETHGIHRVTLPGAIQIDIASFQGTSIEEDLSRRDFSINAMAVPLDAWLQPAWKKQIIDFYDGLKDLKHRRISAFSRKSLKDDPIRLLRAFRIAGELGFHITPATLAGIRQVRRHLTRSAPERIREELLKLFSLPTSHLALILMDQIRLLDVLIPAVKNLRKTAHRYYGKGGVLKHTLDAIRFLEEVVQRLKNWFPACHKKIEAYLQESQSGYPRIAHLKWGALLHDLGKPGTAKILKGRLRFFEHEHLGAKMVEDLATTFRWSTDEKNRYTALVRHHMRPGNLAAQPQISDKAIHRFFRDLGEEAVGLLLLALGDHLANLSPRERKRGNTPHERLTQKMINRFYRQRKRVLPPRLLTGHDIMKAFGLPPSRLIGALLKDLTEAQSEGKIRSKEEGLAYLRGRLMVHNNNPAMVDL